MTLQIDTHGEIARIRALNNDVTDAPPITIGDVGCGNGLFLQQIEDEQHDFGYNDVKCVGLAVSHLPHNLKHYHFGTAIPQFHFPANSFDLVVAWQVPIVDCNTGILENVLCDSLRMARPNRHVAMEQLGIDRWNWFTRFQERIFSVCERIEIGISEVPSKVEDSPTIFRRPVFKMWTFSDPQRKAWADEVITEWCLTNFANAEATSTRNPLPSAGLKTTHKV